MADSPDGSLITEVNLISSNIKSGAIIFDVPGSAAVQEISDADAAVGNVLTAKTFYSISSGVKTGTMPDATLAAVMTPSTVQQQIAAGYHAGTGADAVAGDADLVAASIKSGVNIFGVAGAATVQDIADADLTEAEAPTGKKFYSITGGVKTGTGTKTLSAANDTVAAGYYAATTLHAVDADLAAANIKSGVTVFGIDGSFSSAPAHDI